MNVFVLAGLCVFLASCALDHPIKTQFVNPTSSNPMADSGASWDTHSNTFASDPELIQNTTYCQVDSSRNIISTDSVSVTDGQELHGVGGGCVSRPIREVWAVVLNHEVIRASDVDEYLPRPVPEEVNPQRNIFFVFDVESVVHSFFFDVRWITRWYHSISHGTYQLPNQIVVDFQKTEGTSFIEVDRERYVLDRVTPNITSFVMDQRIRATRVDAARVNRNIREILEKMRTRSPDWSALPENPPAPR